PLPTGAAPVPVVRSGDTTVVALPSCVNRVSPLAADRSSAIPGTTSSTMMSTTAANPLMHLLFFIASPPGFTVIQWDDQAIFFWILRVIHTTHPGSSSEPRIPKGERAIVRDPVQEAGRGKGITQSGLVPSKQF